MKKEFTKKPLRLPTDLNFDQNLEMISALSVINPDLGMELLSHIKTSLNLPRAEEPERRPKEARQAR